MFCFLVRFFYFLILDTFICLSGILSAQGVERVLQVPERKPQVPEKAV